MQNKDSLYVNLNDWCDKTSENNRNKCLKKIILEVYEILNYFENGLNFEFKFI